MTRYEYRLPSVRLLAIKSASVDPSSELGLAEYLCSNAGQNSIETELRGMARIFRENLLTGNAGDSSHAAMNDLKPPLDRPAPVRLPPPRSGYVEELLRLIDTRASEQYYHSLTATLCEVQDVPPSQWPVVYSRRVSDWPGRFDGANHSYELYLPSPRRGYGLREPGVELLPGRMYCIYVSHLDISAHDPALSELARRAASILGTVFRPDELGSRSPVVVPVIDMLLTVRAMCRLRNDAADALERSLAGEHAVDRELLLAVMKPLYQEHKEARLDQTERAGFLTPWEAFERHWQPPIPFVERDEAFSEMVASPQWKAYCRLVSCLPLSRVHVECVELMTEAVLNCVAPRSRHHTQKMMDDDGVWWDFANERVFKDVRDLADDVVDFGAASAKYIAWRMLRARRSGTAAGLETLDREMRKFLIRLDLQDRLNPSISALREASQDRSNNIRPAVKQARQLGHGVTAGFAILNVLQLALELRESDELSGVELSSKLAKLTSHCADLSTALTRSGGWGRAIYAARVGSLANITYTVLDLFAARKSREPERVPIALASVLALALSSSPPGALVQLGITITAFALDWLRRAASRAALDHWMCCFLGEVRRAGSINRVPSLDRWAVSAATLFWGEAHLECVFTPERSWRSDGSIVGTLHLNLRSGLGVAAIVPRTVELISLPSSAIRPVAEWRYVENDAGDPCYESTSSGVTLKPEWKTRTQLRHGESLEHTDWGSIELRFRLRLTQWTDAEYRVCDGATTVLSCRALVHGPDMHR